MLALNNLNYKASIIGILIMLALKYNAAIGFCLLIKQAKSLSFTKFLPIESVETWGGFNSFHSSSGAGMHVPALPIHFCT